MCLSTSSRNDNTFFNLTSITIVVQTNWKTCLLNTFLKNRKAPPERGRVQRRPKQQFNAEIRYAKLNNFKDTVVYTMLYREIYDIVDFVSIAAVGQKVLQYWTCTALNGAGRARSASWLSWSRCDLNTIALSDENLQKAV